MKALHFALILNVLCMCYGYGKLLGTSIRYQDVIVPYVDKDYLVINDLYMGEDEIIISNFTILKRFPENTRIHVVMWGTSMGQYVVPSGLDLELGLCDIMEEPIVMVPLALAVGFKENDCPPSPGTYGCFDGCTVSKDRFPDAFPSNEYLIVTEFSTPDRILATSHAYVVVQ